MAPGVFMRVGPSISPRRANKALAFEEAALAPERIHLGDRVQRPGDGSRAAAEGATATARQTLSTSSSHS
jgi:hypothetical protein